jgi:hypothetical protein
MHGLFRDSITMCSLVASNIGLVEGRDWVRVCMGEEGFGPMIKDLSEYKEVHSGNTTTLVETSAKYCDMSAQTITVSVDRVEKMGIKFSRATYRGSLAVLVHAPIKRRGIWAFLRPLEDSVWGMLLATVFALPFLVVFFESIFSGRWASTHCVAPLFLGLSCL